MGGWGKRAEKTLVFFFGLRQERRNVYWRGVKLWGTTSFAHAAVSQKTPPNRLPVEMKRDLVARKNGWLIRVARLEKFTFLTDHKGD